MYLTRLLESLAVVAETSLEEASGVRALLGLRPNQARLRISEGPLGVCAWALCALKLSLLSLFQLL